MRAHLLLIFSLGLLLATSAHSEMVVVAHPQSGLGPLSKAQLSDLYLGRSTALPGGRVLNLLEPELDAERAAFYLALTGKPLAQIEAYWARLHFAGQQSPPKRLKDDAAVLKMVKREPGSIGYVQASALAGSAGVGNAEVSVLLRLE